MAFIQDDFLLQNNTARHLYERYAAGRPIFDYHSHLPPRDIAENRRFNDLFEIWLEGDHYKWRAMRANGVAERYCTGDARRTRNSSRGRRRYRAAFAIRCITGPISSCSATSRSTNC